MSGFILAGHLLEAGQPEEAIQTLRKSNQSKKVYDFRTQTQLSTEDAYIAAGLAPNTAKSRSTLDQPLDTVRFKDIGKVTQGNGRFHVVGRRIRTQRADCIDGTETIEESKSGTMIDR